MQNLKDSSALQDFWRARRKAALEQIMAYLRGESADLLSYDEVRKKLKVTGSSGWKLQEIPLAAIIGSVGRYSDFTRNFLPKLDSDQTRWANVQAAAARPGGVPPIEAYQIGDVYFVLDGNHRVSVAKQLGATHIEAYVMKVRTKVPLSPETQPDDLNLKAEYAAFLEQTQLDELRPGADFSMTFAGKYQELAEHIEKHQYFMGLEQHREIASPEAAGHWHDHVYLPLVRVIQAWGILRDFPERTATDLYLWISGLRDYAQHVAPAAPEPPADAIQSVNSAPPRSHLEELIITAEYADFLAHTRLAELRPQANLPVTITGRYPILAEHIEVHRYFMGVAQQRDIPADEAAADWYDHVYLPVEQLIREKGILRDFPERTTTDLYLWILEHQVELERQLGWKISPERAAADLASRFSPKIERRLARIGEKILDALTPTELEAGPEPGEWRKAYLATRREDCLFMSILVPVSGRPQSWRALEQAILLSRSKGAHLHGLHVVPSVEEKEGAQALAVKREFEQRCANAGVQGELAIEVGEPAHKICERAFWTDLVVVKLAYPPEAQRTRKLKSGFHTLIRRCSRPILAVPAAALPPTRALLAYDGSPKADEALFVCTYLANNWQTELFVITVTEIGRTTSEPLSLAKSYLRKHGVQATFIEEYGAAGDAILHTGQAYQCDLLVMGGYGRGPVLEIMLGSTVDHVLRESQLPVLICR